MAEVELSPAAATWLLRLGLRAVTERVRNGARPTPAMEETLRTLAVVADAELDVPPAGSGTRTVVATVVLSEGLLPVAEAAGLVGKSESYVQRLARNGRVRHQRIGKRALLIDIESLQSVLRRTG